MLPFTREAFFAVFADYNAAIWPAQIGAYLIAAAAIALVFVRPGRRADLVMAGVLAVMWAWTGIGYHGLYFAVINPAAYVFGAGFVVEALVILYCGWSGRLAFAPRQGWRTALGLVLVAYASVLYPALGIALGEEWPALPMFGVTPCPLTIFTFGAFLLARRPFPWVVLVVPLVWSVVGGSAALLLGVPQDWALLGSGVLMLMIAATRGVAAPGSPEFRAG